ncbi:unnamed protein product [Lathyrus oleraceus]
MKNGIVAGILDMAPHPYKNKFCGAFGSMESLNKGMQIGLHFGLLLK